MTSPEGKIGAYVSKEELSVGEGGMKISSGASSSWTPDKRGLNVEATLPEGVGIYRNLNIFNN